MKKIVFFLLMAVTYYIAGMYQYQSLMVLFLAELFVFAGMYILTIYFKWGLSAEVVKKNDFAGKKENYLCEIRIRNKGKLPVSHLKLRIKCGYQKDSGMVVKNLYGGSECGEHILQFEINSGYCGFVHIELLSMQVYDYLTLFSARKMLGEKMTIAVFPREMVMNIELPAFGISRNNQAQVMTTGYAGDSDYEIRQIREYQEGDSRRHIHWNQSARTDRIWIKEYEKEADFLAEILLDISGFEKAGEEIMDGFYELLSAMVLGMLNKVSKVRVCWYDAGEKCFVNTDITNQEQCKDMFLRLYAVEFSEEYGAAAEAEMEKHMAEVVFYFKLDLELRWYLGETLIYQFLRENLEQEITRKLFVI